MQRSLYVHINNIKLSEFDEIFQHIQFTRKKSDPHSKTRKTDII